MTVNGADSAVPQPAYYTGRKWWGFYVADHRTTPYVWAQAEVVALASSGVSRGLPICVAPTSWPWALGLQSELALLVADAVAWGVPKRVPLVLDLEQSLADTAGAAALQGIGSTWAHLCEAQGYEAWFYGGSYILPLPGFRWLAQWPLPAGQAPQTPDNVPANYSAWQYAGEVNNAIDLDVMTDSAFARLMLTATLSAPTPPDPPPPPPEEKPMYLVKNPKPGATDWWLVGGVWRTHVPDVPTLNHLRQKYKTEPISAGEFNTLVEAKKPLL